LITPPSSVVDHDLPAGAAAVPIGEATLNPDAAGTVTFADPRLCVLEALFRSVRTYVPVDPAAAVVGAITTR
jgi:hypothetical protein